MTLEPRKWVSRAGAVPFFRNHRFFSIGMLLDGFLLILKGLECHIGRQINVKMGSGFDDPVIFQLVSNHFLDFVSVLALDTTYW